MKTCIVTVYSKTDRPYNVIYVDGVYKSTKYINEFDIAAVADLFSEVKMFRVSATAYKNKKKIGEMIA